MRGMKAGDRVTLINQTHQWIGGDDNPTAMWPPEVLNGTVISTHRQKGRAVMCRVRPDPPGFGIFYMYANQFTKEKNEKEI